VNPDEINLGSVNWEFGMLLTPRHFQLQERYFEASLLWMLRYTTAGYGLVGAGCRVTEADRGAVKYDPVIYVDGNENSLRVSVTQCRALTPGGCIVEIGPERPLEQQFDLSSLEGLPETGIYITCEPFAKETEDGEPDEFNPQMKTGRRPLYRLALSVTAHSAQHAVCVGRLRRQSYGAGLEKVPGFIPPCTNMSGCSELAAGWRRILDSFTLLTDRYAELYRAMREFLVLFAERGIETEGDRESAQFVEKMVGLLQDTIHGLLDPVQPPQPFFGQLRRIFYRAAVCFDLNPAVQSYFDDLKQAGETEFITLLNQQRKLLVASRSWNIHEDLSVELASATASIASLQQLERALEGKYLDFRISPSVEAMNFVFDRGGKALYKVAARPSRVQGMADELSIHFSQLRLEGRDKYRLILIGERNARFEEGTRITVEIRLNESSGFRREPIIMSCQCRRADQVNFEYDFDAPDVPTITDIRLSLQAHQPIRTGLLFARHRFYAQRAEEGARTVETLRSGPPPRPTEERYASAAGESGWPGRDPLPRDPAAEPGSDPRSSPERQAPWEAPRRRLSNDPLAPRRTDDRPGYGLDEPYNAPRRPDERNNPPEPPPRRSRLS
jgi:hypothetical protein